MADYTLTARLTANAQEFVAGFKRAEGTVANLQGKVATSGKKFQDLGKRISGVGNSLTKKLTVPAFVATSAVAGVTAALGWKRLTGLDTAQAQLKGLGYNTEEVGRISDQVTRAIDGGMTTMAEGTAIAAGGLAAGVKEGKALERYIKLVGDAAVGANRPVDEMAQIFNRVQGQGKLMTQELNMIEMGLPGFAQAMADELAGGSLETFRKMVTNGEVGSKEFLNVMDDFAGGMAAAYSQSWEGMVKNTLAYVGIIGENLLEGVFQTSKEEIAGFIEVLKSDAVLNWANEFGTKINSAFTSVIGSVRTAKQWFDNLSPAIQNVIVKGAAIGAAFLVGIGPALKIIGGIISGFGTLKIAIAALMGPVGLVIAIFAGLVAAGVALYQNWDTVKSVAQNVFSSFSPLLETVKGAFMDLIGSVGPIWDSLKNLFQSTVPILQALGAIFVTVFGVVVSVLAAVISAVGPVVNAFINLADMLINVVLAAVHLLFGEWDAAIEYWNMATESAVQVFKSLWEGIVNFISTFVETIIDFFYGLYMTLVGNSIIPDMVEAIVEWFQNMFQWLIDIVKNIVDGIVEAFTTIYETVTSYFEMIGEIIESVWTYIKGTFENALAFLVALVTGDFEGMKNAIQKQMLNAQNLLKNIWNAIDKFLSSTLGGIWDTIKRIFSSIFKTIGNILDNTSNTISKVWNTIKTVISTAVNNVKSTITKVFNTVRTVISNVMNSVRSTISNIWNGIRSTISSVVNGIRSTISSVFNAVRSTISSVMSSVRSTISSVWNGIRSVVSSVTSSIRSTISNVFNSLRGVVSNAMNSVRNAVQNGIRGALNAITNMGSSFLNAGRNIVTSIANGIRGAASKVTGAVKDLVSKVRDYLPFSPAKVGPLMDIHRLNFDGPIGDSIDDAVPTIQRKLGVLLELPDQGNPHNVSMNYAHEAGRQQGIYSNQAASTDSTSNDRGSQGDVVFMIDGYELARIQKPHLDEMFGESVDLTEYMMGVR